MSVKKEDLLLYAITDRHWLCGKTLVSQVELALEGGATMIQLREKALYENSFYAEAEELLSLCRRYKVPFIVNDDVALALKIGADGVHVGQGDMRADDVRALIGPDKILGVSTQTVEQAVEAQKCGADYLGVGAVFPTGSKEDAWVLSRRTLKDICAAVNIPVVAIGGITKNNVSGLEGLGFAGISVISAIFAQDDILAAAAELKRLAEEIV